MPCRTPAITDGMVQVGLEAYEMYGAPDKGAVVSLTRVNFLDSAYAFYKVAKRRNAIPMPSGDNLDEFLPSILHAMHDSLNAIQACCRYWARYEHPFFYCTSCLKTMRLSPRWVLWYLDQLPTAELS